MMVGSHRTTPFLFFVTPGDLSLFLSFRYRLCALSQCREREHLTSNLSPAPLTVIVTHLRAYKKYAANMNIDRALQHKSCHSLRPRRESIKKSWPKILHGAACNDVKQHRALISQKVIAAIQSDDNTTLHAAKVLEPIPEKRSAYLLCSRTVNY
jgi:hypothetical protein